MNNNLDIVTFTTLYPNASQPHHGKFVEQRLWHLVKTGFVRSTVVAPVPWFPFQSSVFKSYARFASAPSREKTLGMDVLHPRYLVVPKIGMILAPWLLVAGIKPTFKKLIRSNNNFKLIDAHYFYPDGVAAALISRYLDKPAVITARGSDINLISSFRSPRKMIRWAANNAAAVVTVSNALKEKLVILGVNPERIVVLRNGVDLDAFSPMDRLKSRNRLSVNGKTLLSIGHLIESKGHHIAIEAISRIPDVNLLIVGNGPMRAQLIRLAHSRNVADRVRFMGSVKHEELPHFYSAVDATLLITRREGMPNVILESLACGTPVIATKVGGIPEVVDAPEAGILIESCEISLVTAAVQSLMSNAPDRNLTRMYAQRFSWDETTIGQLELFDRVVNEHVQANKVERSAL